MANYREVFPKKHTLLLVVHAETMEQTLRNVNIAHELGADGVFLINMHGSPQDLRKYYLKVRSDFPEFWVGLNFLRVSNEAAMRMAGELQPNGLWLDDAGYDEESSDTVAGIRQLKEWQKYFKAENTLIFGGIAFKYQKKVHDPARAAQKAAALLDVVTTSGPGTGKAADVHKIKAMKSAIGISPLGIASGITPDNVSEYKEHIDAFLVFTGVAVKGSDCELDPQLVKKLRHELSE